MQERTQKVSERIVNLLSAEEGSADGGEIENAPTPQ